MPVSNIAFNDLRREANELLPELVAATTRVLQSGWFILGKELRAFESELASWLDAPAVVGVASGTDAIEIALRTLGIGPGDEVVTQANTCVPTVAAIHRSGATPVLCDVRLACGTMDPESLEQAITPRTAAVLPVHLYGQCADLDEILDVSRAHGLRVIEDCAQAQGATYRNRTAGTVGDLGAFSFYPTKNLGAVGDAGAVCVNQLEFAERARALRHYGMGSKGVVVDRGVNSRLDELQAAVLRAKLPRVHAWNERRRDIAGAYDAALVDHPVRPLTRLKDRVHVYHLYVVLPPDRDEFVRAMSARGIATMSHYPLAIHQQPSYAELGTGRCLTSAEELAASVVSLPLYPGLTDSEVEHVVAALTGLR